MGTPAPPPSGPSRIVNVRALWAGGAASAVVAALVAVVGVLICEGVLDLEMAPPPLLPIGRSLSVQYAVTSAVLALAATGLAHVLVLTTPLPSPSSPGSSGSSHRRRGRCTPRELGVLGRPPRDRTGRPGDRTVRPDARAIPARQDDTACAARSLARTRSVRPDHTPTRRPLNYSEVSCGTITAPINSVVR